MNTAVMLAFLALVCAGGVQFFSKVAGANQAYGPSYMIAQALTFALVGVVTHLVQRHPFDLSTRMTGIAALSGVLGGIAVLALLLAFKLGGQGSIIFPIVGLSVIVTVILSFIVYHEPVTATKLLGLGLGVSSIVVLSR